MRLISSRSFSLDSTLNKYVGKDNIYILAGCCWLLCQDSGGRGVNDGGKILKNYFPLWCTKTQEALCWNISEEGQTQELRYLAQTPGAAG